MAEKVQQAIDALQKQFADIDFAPAPLNPDIADRVCQLRVKVPPDRLLDVMRFLRNDDRCRFEQLNDLTCVDYLNFPDAVDRYGVTYSLLSLSLEQRLWVKCFVNDPKPTVPSVVSIWKGADWLEREVFDLFGITFEGHPDLRRLVTWDDFKAHPLRKDYPLRGRGEREDYPVITPHSA